MSEIANSSLDTAQEENTTGGSSNIYTSIRPSIDTTASQAPIAPEDPEKPPVRPMVDENSAAGKAGVNAKEDWFLKSNCSDISTKIFLMSMVLTDLANLNQRRLLERL
jgi:hypothetical protein